MNGSDFALLAGNFGKSGMTFAQGDLNGDGSVNGSDFALLAGNFGRTLPAVQTAAAATAPATAAVTAPAPSRAASPAAARAARPVVRRQPPRILRLTTSARRRLSVPERGSTRL